MPGIAIEFVPMLEDGVLGGTRTLELIEEPAMVEYGYTAVKMRVGQSVTRCSMRKGT